MKEEDVEKIIYDKIDKYWEITMNRLDGAVSQMKICFKKINSCGKFMSEIDRRCKDSNELTKKCIQTNECVEESLLIVLLAIKQNEYLQAYYPEQKGYPEQKVTGQHPSKIEKLSHKFIQEKNDQTV